MVVAQLVVHALYWSSAWRPEGLTDGSDSSASGSTTLLRLLDAFNLDPWFSVVDGVKSMLPDVVIFALSVSACLLVRMNFNGRIQWMPQSYCSSSLDNQEAAVAFGWYSGKNTTMMQRIQSIGSDALSASILLLHVALCTFLFFAAILQPSLLSLLYLLIIAASILCHVFFPHKGSGADVMAAATIRGSAAAMESSILREDDLNIFQQIVFAHGSHAQRIALSLLSFYIMTHLILIHLAQFALIRAQINMNADWVGMIGLFSVDAQ